ncbi:murein L,D-transpeptidase catalytic domain family protein [Photobacterium makurazakiensis]|uniref:murein L,D-transpeptidase catalytic domain family protein n=1 Tax=Photobacterium makurazakiensis TaxID=2910234 RepID=UPI003D097BF2
MCRIILLLLLFSTSAIAADKHVERLATDVYQTAKLRGVIDYELFREGVEAYMEQAIGANPNLVIIDFSRPSNERRFYVINLLDKELKYHTYTTHGIASGKGAIAERFSNTVNSKQTSLGIYKTAETYYGKYGYSLRLDGLSKGLNDNARKRYIVIHGANYASPSFLEQNNFIGWSWGCPALPLEKNREIIDLIKGGSIILAATGSAQGELLAKAK